MGKSGLFVRLSWEEWLLYCMQRMQAAWRGILVCLCASWGETDQALSGQMCWSDPSSIGAGRPGTVARYARHSAAEGRNSSISTLPFAYRHAGGADVPSRAAERGACPVVY